MWGGIMSINDSFFESQEVQLLKKELFGLNDVYRDIADEIGIENTLVIYKLFHGTQVVFHQYRICHIVHAMLKASGKPCAYPYIAQNYFIISIPL